MNTMMNKTFVGFPQIKHWIEKNPYQTVGLPTFSISKEITVEAPILQTVDGWTKVAITPPTPLCACLLEQDSIYSSLTFGAKQEKLREETTDIVEKAALHLKGHKWPVRRTAEGISAVGLNTFDTNSWTSLGWRAICALRECQFVVINETKKEIQFYPEDVRTWSKDYTTIFVDNECRFLFTKPDSVNVKDWLISKESDNWTIAWPIPDTTMEELKTLANNLSIILPAKPTKANLSKKIGREQSLRTIQ